MIPTTKGIHGFIATTRLQNDNSSTNTIFFIFSLILVCFGSFVLIIIIFYVPLLFCFVCFLLYNFIILLFMFFFGTRGIFLLNDNSVIVMSIVHVVTP